MIDPHVNNPKSPKFHVKRYLHEIKDELKDKIVLDIPAGNGVTSEILLELGSKVEAYDLFPDNFLVKEIECKKGGYNKGPAHHRPLCRLCHLPGRNRAF